MIQLDQALVQWRQALGQDWVCTDSKRLTRESLNTSEFSPRPLLACLSPANSDEVVQLVEIAAKYSVPLYPFSTGKNWGLGSRLPVKGPSVLVNLSRMNRILEVNEEFQYATIEPGVTQGQLSDYLIEAESCCKLNVTGAGRRTSVVGNILERGAGYLGPRSRDLIELEVVLGNGKLVKTGSWHLLDKHSTTTPQHYYPPGLGADLTGLFVQSNFGIVTRMVVKLHPIYPSTEVSIEVAETALSDLIDEIRKLRDEGILYGNIRYTDGGDRVFQLFPENQSSTFLAQAMIRGCRSMRISGREEIEKRLKPIVNDVSFFDNELDEAQLYQVESRALLQKRQNLLYGIPFDQRIEMIAQHSGKTIAECNYTLDQDRDLKGFLCVNVAIPFAGRYVLQVANVVRTASKTYGFKPAILFATLGERALSGFFPFYFDRNNREEIQHAHDLKQELHQELANIGIYPMRSDVDSLHLLSDSARDSFWETLGSIKSVLDPKHVIAPGRYCP